MNDLPERFLVDLDNITLLDLLGPPLGKAIVPTTATVVGQFLGFKAMFEASFAEQGRYIPPAAIQWQALHRETTP